MLSMRIFPYIGDAEAFQRNYGSPLMKNLPHIQKMLMSSIATNILNDFAFIDAFSTRQNEQRKHHQTLCHLMCSIMVSSFFIICDTVKTW